MDQNVENTSKQETKKEKFKISLAEPLKFDAISSGKFITSNDFCKSVSEVFHAVFADYEGCIFEVTGNEPTISLIFNHGEYGEDATVACTRHGASKVGSSVIDRGRARDFQMRDGDRFYLSDNGKDVTMDLLIRRLYNNGNPDMKRIVSDFTDRGPSNSYFMQQYTQYTKVSFLSLDRLASLLFGDKDENGEKVEYSVNIATAINPGYATAPGMMSNINYILNVTRISSAEVNKLCAKLGLNTSNINIVR